MSTTAQNSPPNLTKLQENEYPNPLVSGIIMLIGSVLSITGGTVMQLHELQVLIGFLVFVAGAARFIVVYTKYTARELFKPIVYSRFEKVIFTIFGTLAILAGLGIIDMLFIGIIVGLLVLATLIGGKMLTVWISDPALIPEHVKKSDYVEVSE